MFRKIFAIVGALITGGLGIAILVAGTQSALAFGRFGGGFGGGN